MWGIRKADSGTRRALVRRQAKSRSRRLVTQAEVGPVARSGTPSCTPATRVDAAGRAPRPRVSVSARRRIAHAAADADAVAGGVGQGELTHAPRLIGDG